MPRAPMPWLEALTAGAPKWGINTKARFAAFAGQLAHECDQFTNLEENLSYSAERLVAVWPKRFPTLELAKQFARAPEKLANHVYAGRLGNGTAESGDGWAYRGRGPIQTTGFDNYKKAGEAIGVDLIAAPEKLLIPAIGIAAAGWYWESHGCNEMADHDYLDALITYAINGGDTGLGERRNWTKKILGIE